MTDSLSERPHTVALMRVLASKRDPRTIDDLLYLEAWERDPAPTLASTLKIGQIRRANPELAAEIRAELRRGRPLTEDERRKLAGEGASAGPRNRLI
jgi:hypothetical protein